jgi:hypothetical protein
MTVNTLEWDEAFLPSCPFSELHDEIVLDESTAWNDGHYIEGGLPPVAQRHQIALD